MENRGPKRVLIVGGVAGGASCAARLRRLCETCEIMLFDRGPYVSFANCGLPYHVGNVIRDEERLIVASPELFERRFNIAVRTETEVLRIDPKARTIHVRDLRSSATRSEPYDALVLATGARPVRPPLPGIDLPGIFVLRTIPDTRQIRNAVERASRAVGGRSGLHRARDGREPLASRPRRDDRRAWRAGAAAARPGDGCAGRRPPARTGGVAAPGRCGVRLCARRRRQLARAHLAG